MPSPAAVLAAPQTSTLERMLGRLWSIMRARWRARVEAVQFERKVIISTDDSRISVVYPDGRIESIAWAEVNCVAIETNDSGPWGTDVWWLFEGPSGRCAYPQGATGDPETLQLLPTKFPGFKDEVVIEAMGSTSNHRFICWEREHAL